LSIQLQIGADVGSAIVAVKDLKNQLQQLTISLEAARKAGNPAEIQRLGDAIVNTKNQIQQANAGVNAFATSTFGVSRATRIAHNDLDQMSRSIGLFASGNERGVDTLSQLVFTFERLKGATGSGKAALGALAESFIGPAGLLLAFSTAINLFTIFGDKLFGLSDAEKKAAKQAEELNKAQKQIFDSVAGEAAKVEILVAALRNETLSRQEKLGVIKQLQEIAPQYFGSLDKEKFTIEQLTIAYDNYKKSIQGAAEARGLEKQLDAIISRRLDLEKILKPPQFVFDAQGNRIQNFILETTQSQKLRNETQTEYNNLLKNEEVIASRIAQLKPTDLIKPVNANDATKGLSEIERKTIELAKDIAPLFEIKPELNFSKLDTAKQELAKALKILVGVQQLTIPLKINPKIDFSGKNIEPPKIEDLPIDLGTVGIDLKGKDKFDDRLAEGLSKGIIVPINITPDIELKNVPSSDQEKILNDLAKEFNKLGDIGNKALLKINIAFPDTAVKIVKAQEALKILQNQFKTIEEVAAGVGDAFAASFGALLKNQSPIKAFFSSLERSLEQIISKLIATKIQSVILSSVGLAAKATGATVTATSTATASPTATWTDTSGFGQNGIGIRVPTMGSGLGTHWISET